jgi:hypothetical protein
MWTSIKGNPKQLCSRKPKIKGYPASPQVSAHAAARSNVFLLSLWYQNMANSETY